MDLSESQQKELMERCITLAKEAAKEGVGYPLVGALVLDASGKIIGEGYKTWLKGSNAYLVHAERSAIMDAEFARSLNGATLVTTLEPCISVEARRVFKPCSQLIAESGIARVIIGLTDDSPSTPSGEGISYLRNRNIEVVVYRGLEKRIVTELMPIPYRAKYFQASIQQKSGPSWQATGQEPQRKP